MKSTQDKLSALFSDLKQVEPASSSKQKPIEKPFTERMKRQLSGKDQEDHIMDPANPNLIERHS